MKYRKRGLDWAYECARTDEIYEKKNIDCSEEEIIIKNLIDKNYFWYKKGEDLKFFIIKLRKLIVGKRFVEALQMIDNELEKK